MRLIAKKPCSYGGKKFFIGDEIPAELVVNIEREEKLGVISAANDEAGVPEQSMQNGGGILSVVRQDQLPAPYILGQDGIHHGPDESAALIGRQQDQYLFFHGLILTQCPAAGQRNGPAPPAGQRFRQTPGGHSPACAGSPPPSFRPPGPPYPVPH